ncbi:protein kinase [Glycomyces sp. NPDC047369]
MNKAIIVGIDSYPDAPLAGCVRDASDVASCLSLPQYDFDSTLILNDRATRTEILKQLHRIAYADEHYGEESTLLFYFAGHGQVVGQAGHLVTHDAEYFDPGISLANIAQIMESASRIFDHVVSILDCCHSGSAFTWTNSRPLAPSDVEREVHAVNESRCVLAACRPEQEALEVDYRGVFTEGLTDALLGDAVNWDGDVTLMGIYECVARAMPEGEQTPVFKGDVAGTVVIGRGFEPRQGRPIEKNELTKIIAKAQALIDSYYNLEFSELTDRGTRLSRGAKRCAKELESVVKWFDDTERANSQISADRDWKELKGRLFDFRKHLADMSVGEETRFGRITHRIGDGGFGNVWAVEDEEGHLRALKVFHGNELEDEIKVRRFTNGYASMRKLDHPHIVKVFEMTQAPFGFLMEYIQGSNLRKAFIERHGNAEVVVRLMIDICETVQYAHAQGVLHRDIKPENIIVERDAEDNLTPYLTDFDLAYHETNRTMTIVGGTGVGGVINYAAPEQLYAPDTWAARSVKVDVFSLAQLMFYLIVGKDPTPASSTRNNQMLTRVLSNWVDDRAAEPLLEMYKRASLKEPEERPQDVTEFVASLRTAEAFIQLASGPPDLLEEDFWGRVGNSYAGLGRYEADAAKMRTTSVSEQVEIIGQFRHVTARGIAEVELEFSVTQNIPMGSFKSGKQARERLNKRLDKLLSRQFGHTVRRRDGQKGMYQVFVTISDVKFHIESVTRVSEVITTTVNAIESW